MADNRNRRPIPPLLIIFIALILGIVVLGIGGYVALEIAQMFLQFNPTLFTPFYDTLLSIISFIDNSIWVGFILLGIVDMGYSYEYPEKSQAVFNIIGIFVAAYIFFSFAPAVSQVSNAIPFNSIIPTTFTTFSNGYLLFILVIMMILSAVFNDRTKN